MVKVERSSYFVPFKKRQVKDMKKGLSNKDIRRIIEYLKAQGWTDVQIMALIAYITKK